MSRRYNNSVGIIIGIIISLIFIPQFCKKSCSKSKQQKNYSQETKKTDYRYHLDFGEEFKKGLASEDDLGISIVLAVDCSGSMDDYPVKRSASKKYVIASESLTEIMGFLENFYNKNLKSQKIKLKIGLLRFSDNSEVMFNLTEMNDENFIKLKSVTSNINNFIPQYKTAIGETLSKGAEILVQSGTIFKSLIVITDGENTKGVRPEDALTAIVENLNNKNTSDLPVLTDSILVSFVGFDIDADVFSNLKNIGSRVTSADNKEELLSALKNIFLADLQKLEAK